MSTAPTSRLGALFGPGGAGRRYAPLAALALVAVVFSAVVAQQPPSGLPLDPRSTDAAGTKALAVILERVGAAVETLDSPADPDVDTLLVLADNLDQRAADDVRAFVERGGTAVVVDDSGLLTEDLRPAGAAASSFVQLSLTPGCDVAAFSAIDRVRPGSSRLFVVPEGATGCFGDDEAAWLIIREIGTGNLVTTGGPTFVTNALIGEQDNAVLAVALLAPEPGTRVGILEPQFAPEGGAATRSLGDLIPDRVVGAALQLLVAFLVVVLWRARRLGKPVSEPQQVQLVGSEIVVAAGNLYQRTGAAQRAAELLRRDLRRSLSEQLGVPHDLPVADVAAIAAQRTRVAEHDVVRALTPSASLSDAGLVELAQLVESVRSAIRLQSPVLSGATRANE